MRHSTPVLRCWLRVVVALAAEAAMVLGLHTVTVDPLRQVRTLNAADALGGRLELSVLVVAVAAAIAWVALAFVVASTVAATAALIRRRTSPLPGPSRLAGPRWLQRAVFGVCGLSLLSPVAAGASPATARWCDADPGGPAPAPKPMLTGLPMPDLPTSERRGAAVHLVRSGDPLRRGAAMHLVRSGDSLWSIAQQRLPTSATESAISRHVNAVYAANRDVIGPDPNLIFPGTRLLLPGGKP